MEEMIQATRALKKLLETGEITEQQDRELYREHKNPQIREILSVFEDELDFHLVDAPGACYLSPDMDNELFGFQSSDFRRWHGADGLKADGFLICHIIMIFLHLFFGGHNQNPKKREFLLIGSLVEEVDKRFRRVLEDPEAAVVLEEQASLNYVKIAEIWSAKQIFEEGRRKTKEGTVMNAMNLMMDQNLIRLSEDGREIRTTQKLDDLMIHWFLSESRVIEIEQILGMEGS